LRARATAPEFK